ncbi:hypothetical protein F5Y19DRAFT_465583 [Xylariaceae sp. FL1651]|nr:hypothetical protein F5Y19DRAFT_465583 [Xylariaceae sp. FL1651]
MNYTSMQVPDVEASPYEHGYIPKIQLAVGILMGLASAMVTLRVFYRLFQGRRHLWSDDYFLIAALLCLIGNGVEIWSWVRNKYEPNVTATPSPEIVLTGSLLGLFNSMALAFSKTSLAITFIRLTPGWWKSSLGISIFVISVLFFVQGWSYWVQDCDGPPEPFRVQNREDSCLSFESIRAFRLAVQSISCVLDLYFTILPWKIVHGLELKQFEKIGLAIAMSFGFVSLASGLVRLAILLRLSQQTYEHQPFYAVGGYLWNFFEPAFSILAGCIPFLRKAIVDIMQWKKKTPVFNWIRNRCSKQSVAAAAPLSDLTRSAPFESNGTLEKTDTTATTVVSISSAKSGKVMHSSELGKSWIGLPRIAYT